jgi:hypothetical protein
MQSQSQPGLPLPVARLCTAAFNSILHLPVRLELRFQFPYSDWQCVVFTKSLSSLYKKKY